MPRTERDEIWNVFRCRSFATLLLALQLSQNTYSSTAFTSPSSTRLYTRVFSEEIASSQRHHERLSSCIFVKGNDAYSEESSDPLVRVVKQSKLDKRMITIDEANLPLVAELYAGGSWKLGIITEFKTPISITSASIDGYNELIKPPLLKVLTVEAGFDYVHNGVDEHYQIVDAGQVTTIWNFPIRNDIEDYAQFLSNELATANKSLKQDLPVSYSEELMQSLYESIMVRSNARGQTQLTKKDVTRLASSLTGDDYMNHAQQLLKKAVKIGLGGTNGRLIESLAVAIAISKGKNESKNFSKTQLLLSGAVLLALDAQLGGRFKRGPAIFVSANYEIVGEDVKTKGLTLLNGGWFAVDKSVRAGAEARKFAERSVTADLPNGKRKGAQIFTAADERIMYRLECLAMGEELGRNDEAQELELDVREALSALSLEQSPEGAQKALVKVGRWSPLQKKEIEGRSGLQKMFSPWSSDVLNCAKALKEKERLRRSELFIMCSKNKTGKQAIDGRLDLTALPAICIDAKRASFRDDAIGVRPRSSTGRKVKAGCKFELLIHIADVSDIYAPEPKPNPGFDLNVLRKSAEGRGSSRYDLPLGPLHLMPPVALEALALDTKKINQTQNGVDSVNRCVTLWVYIDTATGRILDSGLERTLICKPLALSFEDASKLQSSGNEEIPTAAVIQTKSLLDVIELDLSNWKENRLKTNDAARKREKRLQVREMVAKETVDTRSMRDDGAKGSFQRSRGHRIVDNALDLYGVALSDLLIQAKAPIPRASGSGKDRGGRLGTAPLRRYIDGVAQRQALSVLCKYGGPPMTRKECSEANKIATEAMNNINNLKSSKKGSKDVRYDNDILKKKKALRTLASHFASNRGLDDEERIVPAMSTGNNNEVVLSGIGVLARCDGVKGTLKSGERVQVNVTELNVDKGIIKIELVKRKRNIRLKTFR